MKYSCIFALLSSGFSLHGMEENGHDKKEIEMEDVLPQKERNDAFESFSIDKFCKLDVLLNLLITSKLGRKFILKNRTSELLIARLFEQKTGEQLIGTSKIYLNMYRYCVVDLTGYNASNSEYQDNKFILLTQAIAHVEKFLVEKNSELKIVGKTELEQTRIYDLILLKTILEQDNPIEMKGIPLYEFTELLQETHKKWPPCKNNIFSPLSGYEVIKKALEVRKNNGIDNQDESSWRELWSWRLQFNE